MKVLLVNGGINRKHDVDGQQRKPKLNNLLTVTGFELL